MKFEKGIDGSYFHNNLVIIRDDERESHLFYSSPKLRTISAFLNGYAIIPLETYYKLVRREIDERTREQIKEADKQLHKRGKNVN